MRYLDFINLNYNPRLTDAICIFSVEKDAKSLLSLNEIIGGVAAESSTGTWAEVSTEKPYMRKLSAKVFYIKRISKDEAIMKIAYPEELFEFENIPNFMSSIAGNIFGLRDIKNLRLEDINFPTDMIKKFRGPKFGIEGIRKMLGVKERPLIGTIIKPKLGLKTFDHVQAAYNAWLGGCDIVKDDENLSSQSFNKFEERLKETLKMKHRAEKFTGEKKIYMVNITAETEEMIRRAKLAKEYGNEYVMIDILTCGWSALQTLRKHNEELNLVLHAHRAGHATFTRNQKHGISMLVIAKIARLIGVDQIHIGTIVGKMEGSKKEVTAIDQEIEKQIIREKGTVLSENWHHIKPVFAVCSGGLHPGHIPTLVKYLGKDIIIQMGGGIHAHPDGTISGAIAARQAVDAVMKNINLDYYSETHLELKQALEKWC